MTTPQDADPATLRFAASLADGEARAARRHEVSCKEKKLPGHAHWASSAGALESLARCLRNRASRLEKAKVR